MATMASEIVVARAPTEKIAMLGFLRAHGVPLQVTDDFQALGVVRDGHLIAVVAFNTFCGRTCSMHVAGDGGHWVNRELLKASFAYPFKQLDLVSVLSPVAADNERGLKFEKHLGFEEVLRVPEGWAHGVDLVLLELQRARCRWIEGEANEQQAA
jgi:hypothetical protein